MLWGRERLSIETGTPLTLLTREPFRFAKTLLVIADAPAFEAEVGGRFHQLLEGLQGLHKHVILDELAEFLVLQLFHD